MANSRTPHFLLLIVVIVALSAAVWALARFPLKRASLGDTSTAVPARSSDSESWERSLEKIKENRSEAGNVAIEIPDQLRHYDERRWFLAAQVAEVKKFNLQPVQDFVDLAAMIQRGELVPLPAVTDTYILYGVGARVDGDAFTRYVADQNLELNDEAGLRDAYARLKAEHAKLQQQISELEAQLDPVKDGKETKQDELETELATRKQELKSNEGNQALINQYYGYSSGSSSLSGSKLWRDYDALQALATNFGGRSFNLEEAADREILKVYLLSSLRPPALKVLEEIAKRYRDNFGRPLPVSSLIRPEQYQRALRRVNRYAVLIDTPPHSTGLAFDIDYRYMSNAEQNFVMNELARMKDEGRIEVLRERGANYHVFVFIDGRRPSDELITASLNEVGPPPALASASENGAVARALGRASQSQQTSAKVATNSRSAKNIRRNAKPPRPTDKAKARQRR